MQQDHTTPAPVVDPLDRALVALSRDGWRLQARSPMTMQLVRPKRFNKTEGWLLAILCIVLVLFLGVTGLLLGVLVVIGDFVWYAARHDETRLVTLESVTAATSPPVVKERATATPIDASGWAAHSRSIGACEVCGMLLGGRKRCPRCGKEA